METYPLQVSYIKMKCLLKEKNVEFDIMGEE
jgi:hypothetical protein